MCHRPQCLAASRNNLYRLIGGLTQNNMVRDPGLSPRSSPAVALQTHMGTDHDTDMRKSAGFIAVVLSPDGWRMAVILNNLCGDASEISDEGINKLTTDGGHGGMPVQPGRRASGQAGADTDAAAESELVVGILEWCSSVERGGRRGHRFGMPRPLGPAGSVHPGPRPQHVAHVGPPRIGSPARGDNAQTEAARTKPAPCSLPHCGRPYIAHRSASSRRSRRQGRVRVCVCC